MEIKTLSLIPQIEVAVGKLLKDITTKDLLKVTALYHNLIGLDNSVSPIKTSDLLLFKNLKTLGFSNSMFYSEDLLNISMLKNLTKLSFYNCEIHAEGKILNSLQHIEYLDITQSQFNSFEFIKNFKSLKTLQIDKKIFESKRDFFTRLKNELKIELISQTKDEGD